MSCKFTSLTPWSFQLVDIRDSQRLPHQPCTSLSNPNKERHMTSLTKWPPSSGRPGMPFLTSTKNKKTKPHVAMVKTPIARWFRIWGSFCLSLLSTSTSPIPLVPLHSWLSRRCWTSPTFVWFFFRCSMRLTSCLFSASRSKPACCSPWALASTWAVKWLMWCCGP